MTFDYHVILGLQITFNTNCGLIQPKNLENKPPAWAKQYKQVIKRTQTKL